MSIHRRGEGKNPMTRSMVASVDAGFLAGMVATVIAGKTMHFRVCDPWSREVYLDLLQLELSAMGVGSVLSRKVAAMNGGAVEISLVGEERT